MKKILVLLLMGAVVTGLGCNKESTPGGPGASLPESEQATIGQTEDSFSLETPGMATNLAQGETKEVTIGIKRGKNLDQDVTLAFSGLPNGVTVEPAGPVIQHGAVDAKMSLKAADDAALGDFTVKVIGHPATGPDATSEFKVSVTPK